MKLCYPKIVTKKSPKEIDFLFVLPGFTFSPPGGYSVVFELAKFLKEKNYRVSIIFIRNIWQNLRKFITDPSLDRKSKYFSLRFRFFNKYLQYKPILNLIAKGSKLMSPLFDRAGLYINSGSIANLIDIDWEIRNCVPSSYRTKRAIATAWETAYFVDHFEGVKQKYYLVQHSEDDPSFSGSLSHLAKKTYDLDLKKIVINKTTLARFKGDDPIKITVAAHINGKCEITPELRGEKICIQLRSGDDKGAIYGIEAVRIIHDTDPVVKIQSYGSYGGSIPLFINHTKFLPEEEYIRMFNECSVFILPSLVEGFSSPVLEAMSCGCVPVATACGGPEEIINSGENGILVPTKSPSAIAEAVLKLIQDENTRTLLSKNALRRSKDFSFEKMGESFLVGITSYEETLDR